MLLSYIIPTRDRPERLALTLSALGRLNGFAHDANNAEVIIVDNASAYPVTAPERLANGLSVRTIHRLTNDAAAARNYAAKQARGRWLVMLDDDSHPLDADFARELDDAPRDVAAIGAEISLSDGSHEAGALPEVFTGCGVAIRRDVFNLLGGYDPAFAYYAEEYDFCARLLLDGYRVVHTRMFRVLHYKDTTNRDMNVILRNLVRNNAWVALRYAPIGERSVALNEAVARYGQIAEKEKATRGYELGLRELRDSADDQPRREMSECLWRRFTGITAAADHLDRELAVINARKVAIVDEGKNAWAIRRALEELGVFETTDMDQADALVIGTLSPGPMLDAHARRLAESAEKPIVLPWQLVDHLADVPSAATIAA